MSTSDQNLILHLDFMEIRDNQVEDASDSDHDGTLGGTHPPVLAPDEIFGSCLSFDGVDGYVSLPDLGGDYSKGLTLEAWVFYTKFNNWSRIFELGDGAPNNNIVLANDGTTQNLTFHIYRDEVVKFISARNVLEDNAWMHLAATIDKNAGATLYVNGEQVATSTLHLPKNTSRRYNYIGRSSWPQDAYFQGKIFGVRVYTRALSADEISQDMNDDRTATASFHATYPLDFNLYDDDDQPVIYIVDDPAGQNLHLEISNTSRQAIELVKQSSEDVSASNHHFELRFRHGVLSPAFLDKITLPENDWRWTRIQQGDGTDSFYLLSPNERTINPNEKVNLTLQHVGADARDGARGTRVELKFRQLRYVDSNTSIDGTRVRHLSIANRSGKQNIPLHVGFVGSDTILNDGNSPNDLQLRVTNLLASDSIVLNPAATGTPTKFVISYDVQGTNESKEWALGTQSQVAGINIHWGLQGIIAAQPTTDSSNAYVNITPPLEQDIPAGASLPVVSKNGSAASITLAIAAQKGQSLLTVQKLTTSEQKSVVVAGSEIYFGDAVWKLEPSTLGITPQWTFINQKQIEIAPGKSIQLRITNIKSSLPSGFTNLYIRYENIPGYWDGQFVCPVEKAPIVYRQSRVGIGTANPVKPLVIRAAEATEELIGFEDLGGTIKWHLNQKANAASPGLNFVETGVADARLYIKAGGNVGIGTSDPKAKLQVTQGAIMPEAGNSENAGLLFPKDPGGGVGDAAWIRYYPRSGEATTLEIGVANDANDHIALMASGGVAVGTRTPATGVKLTSSATTNHLQLRRESTETTGGKVLFLELFQNDGSPAAVPEVYPSIRFHHSYRFWHRIEARQDGIYFKDGDLNGDGASNIFAAKGTFSGSVQLDQNNYIQKGMNFSTSGSFKMFTGGTFTWNHSSVNAITIVGADGGVLATKDTQVLEWHKGAVIINGKIYAKEKYFLIEHPDKPEHHLAHSCLEGAEIGVYYRGASRLQKGEATINLPAYFESLTRKEGRTVLLTAIGREPFRLSYEEIKDGQFKVYGTKTNGEFSWEVKAIRADVDELEVEVRK